MILFCEIPAPAPGSLENFLYIVGTLALIVGAVAGVYFMFRSKPPEPANETLGATHKALSQRVHVVEGSVRKIYERMDRNKDEFNTALRDQTMEILAAIQRRDQHTNEQFQRIEGSLARLDERTKH
jgi:hypothetical protein